MPPSTRPEAFRLTFLGTRGEIDRRSARHRRHSSLLVQYGDCRIIIDCGRDWSGRLDRLAPTALLLTHAHPDHAGGLREGAPCPVYATEETWALIGRYSIAERRTVVLGEDFHLDALTCRAFAVEHSTRAPAVGYRCTLEEYAWFYVPDVVSICDAHAALAGVNLYIGDGARMTRPLMRRRGAARIGHTSMRTQLDWCRQEGVREAIFTHCGSEIVGGDGRSIAAELRRLGRERGIAARVAFDGLHLLPGPTAT